MRYAFRKIGVGISGGVDSGVAALLLKQKGFELQGVFMKNWDDVNETGYCSIEKDYQDALNICLKLSIPLHRVDFVKQYWNEVFNVLIDEYQAGRTPNPDILCNRYVKFDSFYRYCRDYLDCDAIATGHYANSSFGPFLENYAYNLNVKLMRPQDKFKDQTFFLSQVKQKPLRKTMFPVASLTKKEVRGIARQAGLLNVAEKRGSRGICFIGKRHFRDFIEEYITSVPGTFVDIDTGECVGEHKGIHQWTIGQRACIGGMKNSYFIFKKDSSTNEIYVASGTNHPALKNKLCFTTRPHWIDEEPIELYEGGVLNCHFRFQHTKPLVPCRVFNSTDGLAILLTTALRALTQGQYAVLYKNDECLGSARITDLGPSLWLTKTINCV